MLASYKHVIAGSNLEMLTYWLSLFLHPRQGRHEIARAILVVSLQSRPLFRFRVEQSENEPAQKRGTHTGTSAE